MNEQIQRESDGRWQKGQSGNPAGRPTRAKELARLAILQAAISDAEWQAIATQAVNDAIAGTDGATRERGRRFIADYIVGRPTQRLVVEDEKEDDSIEDAEYASKSDEELRAIARSASTKRTGTPRAEAKGKGARPGKKATRRTPSN